MKGINCFQYDRERLTLYAFQFHSWSVISDRIRKISWNFIRVGSGSIEWLKLIDSVGHSWGLAHTGWWITNIVIEIEHFTNLIVFFKEMRRYFSIWRWRLWFKRRNCGSSYYFYTPVQGSFKKRREAEQGRVWYKHAVMINYIQGIQPKTKICLHLYYTNPTYCGTTFCSLPVKILCTRTSFHNIVWCQLTNFLFDATLSIGRIIICHECNDILVVHTSISPSSR